VKFPVVKGATCNQYVVKRERYQDFVRGKNVYTDGNVLDASCLGVTHLHRLSVGAIAQLPETVWLHFAYKYVLNIGDSGLYNALYDGENVYGIDMDEIRGKPGLYGIVSMLFVKDLALPLKKQILKSLTENKKSIIENLHVKCTPEKLAEFHGVVDFDEIYEKLAMLKQEMKKL
jgi:hypothetical protein